jgi:inositol transport system substrate-binding protein
VAGHRAITSTLQEQGHTVIERNANEDANRQLEQVRDCIAQGVDGIIIIPQDGESAVTIVNEAQDNDVPIAVFNRPPSDLSKGIVVVADNATIASQAVDHVVNKALEAAPEGEKVNAIIIVGDLGDPNAVGRKDGFYAAVDKHKDHINVTEVASNWDAATALANLERR